MHVPSYHPALLIVVSGPTGSGKTTLCDRMLKAFSPRVQRVITATTRAPRDGEREGLDYFFLNDEEFEQKKMAGEFYESAVVHGYHYGTLKSEITDKLGRSIDILLNIDVQGAETIRNISETDALLQDRVISVFISPQSIEDLRKRIDRRALDKEEEIEMRLNNAREEMKRVVDYDYCIASGTRENDFIRMRSIYHAEKMRIRVLPENMQEE